MFGSGNNSEKDRLIAAQNTIIEANASTIKAQTELINGLSLQHQIDKNEIEMLRARLSDDKYRITKLESYFKDMGIHLLSIEADQLWWGRTKNLLSLQVKPENTLNDPSIINEEQRQYVIMLAKSVAGITEQA